MLKVTCICNAGVMIEYNDKKILIDSFCKSILPIYKNPPDDLKEKMIKGIKPFDNVDMLLFTHNHTDHFHRESAAEFLKNNKDSIILSTDDVIGKITEIVPSSDRSRLIKLDPVLHRKEDIIVKGINIKTFSLLHDGKEYANVKNLAYLIDIGGKKVLHTGDAKAMDENYKNLNFSQEGIDLLIAPFPYVSLSRGRSIIENYIKPKKIVANHLPYRELDEFGWINAAKENYMKVEKDFIETVFFEEIGYSTYV